MLNNERFMVVAGAACVIGAAASIGLGGSAVVAVLLLIGARTLLAPEARGWIVSSVPVWVGVVAVAVWRAGSADLGDIGGAHAVLGSGLLRGDLASVGSMWLVAVAGVAIAGSPISMGERLVWALQAALITALVTGPQITKVGDVIPWVAVVGVLGAQYASAHALGPSARVMIARSATIAAVIIGVIP